MIRFLQHSEIDPEKWNQTVHNSLFPNVLAEYELLNLLTGDDTWHALVQDDYEVVVPLPTRKKGVLKYVYTPFFLPQMGVFSEQPLPPRKTEEILAEISNRYVLADVLLNEKTEPEHLSMEFTSYSLPLHSPYTELYKKFSQNTKRNLKTGERQPCRVTKQEEDVAAIIELFRKNRGQAEAVHYRERDYTTLQRVADHLSNCGLLETYGVRTRDNALAAGAMFVKDGNRRWFWFSGRDNQLSEIKPMFLLLDAYIRDHSDSDLILDFNGSNNPNVARLYHGFGAVPYSIPFVRRFKNRFWEILLSPKLSSVNKIPYNN